MLSHSLFSKLLAERQPERISHSRLLLTYYSAALRTLPPLSLELTVKMCSRSSSAHLLEPRVYVLMKNIPGPIFKIKIKIENLTWQ